MTDQFHQQDGVEILIRPATASDALLLARFRYAFRSSLSRTNESEDEFVQRCSRWMQQRLEPGSLWRCWIAEQNHMPAGHLWVQLIEKIPNPTDEPEVHAYITNFYVQEAARSQGIGSKLLVTALEWLQSQHVDAVILWPTPASRSLYLRHGFAVRDDLLERILAKHH